MSIKPSKPRVLIISKPLAPPWSDGSKNLAKDIAINAGEIFFTILGTSESYFEEEWITIESLYSSSGKYAPSIWQNIKVFIRMLKRDKDIDIYHFFFAPNKVTSLVIKWIMEYKKQKSIHTICSMPISFNKVDKLMFADRIVTVSQSTKRELEKGGVEGVQVIYPGISINKSLRKAKEVTDYKDLKEANQTLILFSGDFEYSGAHDVILDALKLVLEQTKNIKIIFACRTKTDKAYDIEKQIKNKVTHLGMVSNILFFNEIFN